MCPRPAQRPGVVAVYTADDLGDYCTAGPLLVPPPPIPGSSFHALHAPAAGAKDKVRYVGEPIAMIVAESRYIAEDALRDVHRRHRAARRRRRSRGGAGAGAAPRVHEHLDVERRGARGAAQRVTMRRRAPRRTSSITRRFLYDRGASAAIENRAVVAQWDRQAEELTIWDTTQAPIPIRNGLAPHARPARVAGARRSRRSSAAASVRRS